MLVVPGGGALLRDDWLEAVMAEICAGLGEI